MSEERRKTNKSSTGTVPKIKQRNNTFSGAINEQRSRSLTNNVGYWSRSPYSNLIQNPRKNIRNNYTMDARVEEESFPTIQNGIRNSGNENVSSENTSSSASRRNSLNSALKCDNMTKYPDKQQIEDKLNQIREYLKITNSLMTNMKNTDEYTNDENERNSLEKMISDLKDSEKKLVDILDKINEDEGPKICEIQTVTNGGDEFSDRSSSSLKKNSSEIKLDTTVDIESLKEQQMTLLKLQQKAEKKLRDARRSNLFNTQRGGNDTENMKESNNYQHFDEAIKELEDKARRLKPVESSQQNIHDSILAKVESLHNQIMVMHNANDEREELIETLDNRDAELRSQHADLQNKLVELQNKKMQVDQLVAQLQSFGDEEEDIGGQVKKIVTMKDQLKKLKDMLELVKNTETIMQNTTATPEEQAAACQICTSAENFLEKEFQKPKMQPLQNDSNVLRYDNDTSLDSIPKQLNKNSKKQDRRSASICQKIALQTELESKKRELEDLMGKHKASTSNLNHDVGIDTKSEYSCASNTINEAWAPLLPPQHHTDSDRFSSEDCEDDINHYQEINDNHNVLSLSSNYSPSNTAKHRFMNRAHPEYVLHSDFERPPDSSRTPERNVRSSSAATPNCVREQPRANCDQEMKNQVQKQLQLIKSVCDSMLEQQSVLSQSNANVQHLRNNLTPSPLYSDPRRFATPNNHVLTNPNLDVPWFSCNSELNSYQGWLTTNTIQTQSFMLNTLNQCCQMLWLQQRELVSLRNVVSALQERIENQHRGPQDHLPSPVQTTPQENRSSNQFRSNPNHKVNHVSAAFSLPNLNHCNSHPSNVETNFINHSNSHSSRILDPCLNNVNINHLNAQSVEHANNGLHGVNTNINQMWNGQALNNQVAPGNRANNYWDNFRSYSRQNLLSTKNSEVLQNCHSSLERSDRPNTILERTNPFTLMTFSKSNSEQDSTSTSQENTPKRRGTPRHENVRIQPDVLNINQTVHKNNEHLELPIASCITHHQDNENINQGFQMLLNLNAFNDNSSNNSNISEEHIRECGSEQSRSQNEWNYSNTEEQTSRSKLFDELRENVYKEVVSLISANESRPHFLIQLFRDLQMIGSDALRLKILQSIQMIATNSSLHSQNSKRLSSESEQPSEQDTFQEKLSTFPKPLKNSRSKPKSDDFTEFQNIFMGAIPFLNDHEDEIIQSSFLISLKQILLSSGSFKEAVKDTVFQKHFSNILDEIFEQYIGKKVKNVKIHLLQTLNELFCGDLGFIQIIHETNSEKEIPRPMNDIEPQNMNFSATPTFEHPKFAASISQAVKIENGDLCEADQTRVLDDDIEEEGAVGGILEPQAHVESNAVHKQGTCEDIELAYISPCNVKSSCEDLDLTCELSCNSEGLDQIPTRLPTKTKSRSTTPNRGEIEKI